MRNGTWGWTTLLVLACMWSAPFAMADEALDLGSRRELFVDQFLIESMDGAALRLHEPRPAGVAIRFDKPWEGRYCGYVTVIQDGDLYRMYYRGLPVAGADGSDNEVTCYAESRDGHTFTKPSLGLHEVKGSRENNVILAGFAPLSHNFAPVLDTKPGVPPEQRFKALAGSSHSGLVAFASPDGILWSKLQEGPVITKGAFDSQNIAFWSHHENCYAAYFRTWSEGDWGGARWVSRSTSTDFLNWTDPVEMDKGDAPWEHIYTNQTISYFRAPHIYLAIAARFMPGRRVVSVEEAKVLGVEKTYSGDCSDNVLMTSRGGNRYDRSFLGALVKPGIGFENWTSRTNYPARGVVPTGENEISLYIQHNYGQPTGHMVRYTLRPDGFASLNAPYQGGEMLTKPLKFQGSALYINYATSAAGSIRIEIQEPDGTPIKGFRLKDSAEILGNMIDRPVRWKRKTDIGSLAGRLVRLRFVMKDADLYSLLFR